MQEILDFLQNQWELSIGFLIVGLLIGIVEIIAQRYKEKTLSAFEATQLLNHHDAVVLDWRAQAAYEAGHIIGAASLPYRGNAAATLQVYAKKLQKLQPRILILVCAKGAISSEMAADLSKTGFTVHVLRGGMAGWLEAGMPIVKN